MALPVPNYSPMALEWTEQDGAFFDGVFGDSPAPQNISPFDNNDKLRVLDQMTTKRSAALNVKKESNDSASENVNSSNINKEYDVTASENAASETAIASTTLLSTGLSTTKANDNDVLCVRGNISYFLFSHITMLRFDSHHLLFYQLKATATILTLEINTFES